MANKCQDEGNVTLIDEPSHGISSSTSDDKTSVKTRRDSEISAILSERVQYDLQTSVRSDLSSEAEQGRKDSSSGTAEVGQEEPTKPCQSSNENSASGCSDVREKEPDIPADHHSKGSKNRCNFDLNEGSEPITVVAKVGVPIGQPETPLQFGGELGWRSSISTSAFRPAFPSKNGASSGSPRQTLASQGIDLNVAFTMDSEQTQRFDLNDNPCKNVSQIGESSPQEVPRPSSSSYWVDLSSTMKGFNHTRSRPFLLTVPTSEQQLQMMVPIPVQSEISFMPSTFYLNNNTNNNNNNQHPVGPMIPHHLGAYPGGIHVIDSSSPQLLYATPVRPSFGQNVEFFAKKRREPEGGLDYSHGSCRPMASWK